MNSKRRTVIAGNWKMNFTPAEATAFINEIKPMVAGKDACDVIFCAPYVTIAAAQAADELLNVSGVKASFVMFKSDGAVNISARSFGDINVQLIMEALGGGGHQTMAACRLKDFEMQDARSALRAAIEDYKAKNSK